jgi:hypothetical protein
MENPIKLVLTINTDGDVSFVDEITRSLLRELKDESINATSMIDRRSLQGTKAGETTIVGAILVSVLPAVLPQLLTFLKEWISRGNRTVRIKRQEESSSLELEYDISAISREEIKQLISDLTNLQASTLTNRTRKKR